MATLDLVSYIQEQTQQGVSAQVLREALLAAGWDGHDIDNALHDVAAGLHPVTAGASIHEDLAQVRGMVAHLAGRVQKLEATLVSSPLALTSPLMLSDSRPVAHRGSGNLLRLVVSLAIAGGGAGYLLMSASTVSQTQVVGAGVLGIGLLFGAVAVMRRHAWLASVLTGVSTALLVFGTVDLWAVMHLIESPTSLALSVLWVVVLFVMERWIRRYETQTK